MEKKKLTDLTYLSATCNGDAEMIGQIVSMFKSSTVEVLNNMVKNINDADSDTLKRNAHKAKSSFRMIGASDTAHKLEFIELNSTLQKEELAALIEDINIDVDAIYKELATV